MLTDAPKAGDPRTALDGIGKLEDGEIDIADAALQLARVDAPDEDWEAARAHLSEMARDSARLAFDVAADDLSAQAAALAGLIGGKFEYEGDRETYEDPANANLLRVIARRRGLPVALGIVWIHAARAGGWRVHGLDFPAHFMIGLEGGSEKLVLDVFAGGMPLDARALRKLVKRVQGADAELKPALLARVSNRAVLLRLQNNIKLRRLQANNLTGALACTEDMLRIAPSAAAQWREAAVMNQRLERVGAALRCYDRFLGLVPEGEAANRARLAAEELRSRLN